MNQNKNIEVGLYDRKTGDIIQVVSLDDLIVAGYTYDIQLRNYGCPGSHDDYELVVENEKHLAEKIRLGHLARQKLSKQRNREGE